MAVVTLTATRRGVAQTVPGHGGAANVKSMVATVEVGSADSATSTYELFQIPSNARILPSSRRWHDDLASAGSPTLDIGLFAVNSNITSDDDALIADIDVATANATGANLLSDHANGAKRAWEFVSGQSSDPGGSFIVKGTLKDAAVNVGGTVTVQLDYILD